MSCYVMQEKFKYILFYVHNHLLTLVSRYMYLKASLDSCFEDEGSLAIVNSFLKSSSDKNWLKYKI